MQFRAGDVWTMEFGRENDSLRVAPTNHRPVPAFPEPIGPAEVYLGSWAAVSPFSRASADGPVYIVLSLGFPWAF